LPFTTEDQEGVDFDDYEIIEYQGECITVMNTWDIFRKIEAAIQQDFDYITADRVSQPIPDSVNTIAPENIFIESGAKLEFVTLCIYRSYLYRQGC
jgi:hypothetical protein